MQRLNTMTITDGHLRAMGLTESQFLNMIAAETKPQPREVKQREVKQWEVKPQEFKQPEFKRQTTNGDHIKHSIKWFYTKGDLSRIKSHTDMGRNKGQALTINGDDVKAVEASICWGKLSLKKAEILTSEFNILKFAAENHYICCITFDVKNELIQLAEGGANLEKLPTGYYYMLIDTDGKRYHLV
jgi:hypothetical protein